MMIAIKIMMLHVLLPFTVQFLKPFNNHPVFLHSREENER